MNDKQYYFASSSSMLGFHSYFDEIYNPKKLKRIYIIKGGPGTGKSSAIRYVGEHFDKKYKCEYFLCSSDPSSLDGVIINDEVAIIDGTSPHATEAKYPGAVEILLDSAEALKPEITSQKDLIVSLNDEKSNLFRCIYTYLKAAGEIKKENINLVNSLIDKEKLDGAVNRFFRQNLKKENGYDEKIRLISATTSKGEITTDSFEKLSDTKAVIINGKGCEEIIYKSILDKAKEYGIETYISYDALIPFSPNGLCFHNQGCCIVNYNPSLHGEIDYEKYKVINFERFIDKESYNKIRPKLKFSSKCLKALNEEAIGYMKEAASVHKKLEAIYLRYADFSLLDKSVEEILNEISLLINCP